MEVFEEFTIEAAHRLPNLPAGHKAIVMDGGKRGQVVKVCADPTCRVHHPNTPSPQQVERERAEERKRIEKEKLAITTRHRVLGTILQRVSIPLKKTDLLAVAHYLIGHFSYNQVPALAKRHKVEAKRDVYSHVLPHMQDDAAAKVEAALMGK